MLYLSRASALVIVFAAGAMFLPLAPAADQGRRMPDAAISNYMTFGPGRNMNYSAFGDQPTWFGGYPAYGPGGWRYKNPRPRQYFARPSQNYNSNLQQPNAYNAGSPPSAYGYYSSDNPTYGGGPVPRRGGVFDR